MIQLDANENGELCRIPGNFVSLNLRENSNYYNFCEGEVLILAIFVWHSHTAVLNS